MGHFAKLLLLSAALQVCLGSAIASAQECSASDGETIVQNLLDDLIVPFDDAWLPICEATGLDPFDNVYDGSVNLGCGLGDLGKTVCGLEASSCKSMWADIDISQITGLQDMSLTSITVTSTNAASGTTCPYDSKAVDDTSFGCSYSGEGTAAGKLDGTVTADISNIEIRVECDALGGLDDFKETLWQGHATASATGGTATADVKYCAGLCSIDSGVASLVYLGMSDLKMKLSGVSTNIVTDGSSYDIDAQIADEIADTIADALQSIIVDALSPVVSDALNDEVDEILPFPEACSDASSSSAAAASASPGSASVQAASLPPSGSLVCHDAGLAAGSAPFTALNNMTLRDARETSRVAVVREAQVCNPVDDGTTANDRHFVGYVLRPEFGAPTTTLPDAVLRNDLGVHGVRFGEVLPNMLFSPADGDDAMLDVGCIVAPGAYRCTAVQGLDPAASPDGEVEIDGHSVRVGSVRSVCGPLHVDGVAPASSDGWLACYTTIPASAAGSDRETEVKSAFATQTLVPLGADRRLCVPTTVEFSAPAPVPTPGPRLRVTGGLGRSSRVVPLVPSGLSCPLVRSHLDPGLGVFERTPIGAIRR